MLEFVTNNTSLLIGAGIILLILVILYFYGKTRKNVESKLIKYITKAEYGKLPKEKAQATLYGIITKIHKSDLDERMVLVMAEAITYIPVIKLLYLIVPKKAFINWLNNLVQGVFSMTEVMLKGNKIYGDNITDNVIPDAIVKYAGELVPTLVVKEETQQTLLTQVEELFNQVEELKKEGASIEDINSTLSKVKELKSNVENLGEKVKNELNQ